MIAAVTFEVTGHCHDVSYQCYERSMWFPPDSTATTQQSTDTRRGQTGTTRDRPHPDRQRVTTATQYRYMRETYLRNHFVD